MISLVVTDLDGTLWAEDEVVPAAHHDALGQLADRGIPVLAATARRPRYAAAPLQANGLGHLPYVCVDGSIGMADGVRFHSAHFETDAVLWCLDLLADHDLSPVVYLLDGDCDVVHSQTPSTSEVHQEKLAEHAEIRDIGTAAAESPVYSLSMFGLAQEKLATVTDHLQRSGRVNAVAAPELTYGGWGLTINPLGVSKWSGILAYCQREGIDPSQVMTIGDGANDVAMHQESSRAIGVRGGHPDAVAASDHLIDPPHLGGWATVLEFL